MKARSLLNLLRLHDANWEGLVFLSGPLFVHQNILDRRGLSLWFMGVVVNAFTFALNDLVDLPGDRKNPRRAQSPLVSGALSSTTALSAAVVAPFVMVGLVALGQWSPESIAAFAVVMVVATFVDIYQKTSRHVSPLIMDVLFGAAMCAPIPIGVAAYGKAIPVSLILLTAAVGLLSVSLNSVAGNLKDFQADLLTHFRTTAMVLGVEVGDHGRLVCSRAFQIWGMGFTSGAAALFVVTAGDLNGPYSWLRPAATCLAVAASAASLVSLGRLLAGGHPPSPRGQERFLYLGMLAFLSDLVLYARSAQCGLVLALTATWEIAFRLYWAKGRTASPIGADQPS